MKSLLSYCRPYKKPGSVADSKSHLLNDRFTRPKLNLMTLPIDLILHIFEFLELPFAIKLAATCKLFTKYFEDHSVLPTKFKQRFRIEVDHHRQRLTTDNDSWSRFYQRLDNCECELRGYVLDPFTNDFNPYPFELSFTTSDYSFSRYKSPEILVVECTGVQAAGRIRKTQLEGQSRWRTLRNSITYVNGFN